MSREEQRIGRQGAASFDKSSGFIGSRFPVGQFWFPVGCPTSVLYIYIMYTYTYILESVLADRCVVGAAAARSRWRRWRRRRPFCEKRQCCLPRGLQERWRRRPLIANPHTRTRTTSHTVTRNVFFTLMKWKKTKVCACGRRKIWFQVYIHTIIIYIYIHVKNTFRVILGGKYLKFSWR